MNKVYDPILCMMVEQPAMKVKDTKVRDENYLISGMKSQLEQTLKRYKDPKNKNKLVSQYIGFVNNHRVNGKVTEEEYNEFVKYAKSLVGGSAGVRDAKPLSKMDMNELRALYVSLGGDIKRTYGTSKQAMILKIDDLKRKGKDVPQSSFDRAIRMADRFTVWESDEYDDIYVSYEGGTYVLYVEGRPQADGNQQKMIQLAKQEERMRG